MGTCTSGGYSHHARTSVAPGVMPADKVTEGLEVEIELLGQMHKACLIMTPLYDADRARMRR
ncbi:glycine cleavage T C-terminal barrel domain-containing protein [Phycobacter sp. K97]|uniref:glycine cleavage T C-terminal barrel domain-containing protein n=1 Tax=Phycobacter sedimenti TaxID=3133977 RepID=UPI00311E93C0